MRTRRSLMSSIMLALSAVNPFSGKETLNVRKRVRKPKTGMRYAKPPTKAKFKQNQRKQRAISARKKAK